MQKAAESFMAANPDIKLVISGGGSGNGIKALGEKQCDVAMSSRDIKDKERAAAEKKGVKPVRIAVAVDAIVPVVNPEIITGVSLMLLFVMAQNFGIGGESGIFGWPTLLIAHITFNIPYVIFNVGPKLRQLDPSLYNAALDLGCTPRQAFTKVIMPQLSPAILSAFLICLTYSIDDFMISYFNSGTMQTLPIAIYSMTRKKVSPEINALSAVIFCVILAIILISNAADSRAYRRNQKAIRKAMLDEGGR